MAAADLGKPFAPGPARWVTQLPKTGPAKVLSPGARAAALREDHNDLPGMVVSAYM
ncbi:hypothetical protein [Streptomyces sp. NPDC058424]|uniref:hypothetical protein n=1 Tax=Streptomyces sp. NPDC058424 TaxID=3346491 RepID=UPI00366464FE